MTPKDKRLLELQIKLDEAFKRTSHTKFFAENEGDIQLD